MKKIIMALAVLVLMFGMVIVAVAAPPGTCHSGAKEHSNAFEHASTNAKEVANENAAFLGCGGDTGGGR